MLQSTTRLVSLYRLHKGAGCTEPLGVFFCKRYAVGNDDALRVIYHEVDEQEAAKLINCWLEVHRYTEHLPPLVKQE